MTIKLATNGINGGRPLRLLAVAVLTAITAVSPALAGDDPLPPPAYSVKGDPDTGTMIRSNVVTGGGIPLNRRYEELSPEERRKVAGWYEAMPEGDEPPFPVNGLGPVFLTLQKVASHDRERGEWTFVVAVDSAGNATGVSLARGESTEGVRDMATALMLTKFKPARCAGQPCAMSFPVRVTMTRRL